MCTKSALLTIAAAFLGSRLSHCRAKTLMRAACLGTTGRSTVAHKSKFRSPQNQQGNTGLQMAVMAAKDTKDSELPGTTGKSIAEHISRCHSPQSQGGSMALLMADLGQRAESMVVQADKG